MLPSRSLCPYVLFEHDSFDIVFSILLVIVTLIDDVGSFPLPPNVNRETFNRAYGLARDFMVRGQDVRADAFVWENFGKVTLEAFKKKCLTGLDVVND